jgi:alanine dehydrogenase
MGKLVKEKLMTAPEVLLTSKGRKRISIGIVKESILQENRIALIPASVRHLCDQGHTIFIERGAGKKSNFTDTEYSEAGAQIIDDKSQIFECDVILKVAPPTKKELELMKANQMLISPLQIPLIDKEYIQLLIQKRVVALAMEYLMDDDGSFPLVRMMSEMAGVSAIHTAAELLSSSSGGKGILLGGISGVPPAKVVILGGGVVAEHATRAALGLGAQVFLFDDNIYKLMRIQSQLGIKLFTSSINPIELQKHLKDADVVIGAIHSKSGRTRMVVPESMVANMKPGSVIIDVSIDQGGCFETSEVTSHKEPTFEKLGVIHYCVPNIASKIPHTASIAISNIITPILAKAVGNTGIEDVFFSHQNLRNGVYTYKGYLTNQYLADRFDLKYTNLELLITYNY